MQFYSNLLGTLKIILTAMKKSSEAYKSIGEVARILNLINMKNGSLNTHTIRFWEKEFSQIKPKILAGKRRYYNNKEIRMIKLIKHLLKEKGMTIKGVKAVLNNPKSLTLDDTTKYSVSNQSLTKEKIKDKIKKISKIIDELKELKNG